jgi:hypothetical protein
MVAGVVLIPLTTIVGVMLNDIAASSCSWAGRANVGRIVKLIVAWAILTPSMVRDGVAERVMDMGVAS